MHFSDDNARAWKNPRRGMQKPRQFKKKPAGREIFFSGSRTYMSDCWARTAVSRARVIIWPKAVCRSWAESCSGR